MLRGRLADHYQVKKHSGKICEYVQVIFWKLLRILEKQMVG